MKPKVSILCITYNQKKYIAQTLEGFLSQKTNFKIEVIIHDDKSTDGTTEVIQDYAKRFPEIIKPIYEKKNQYSLGNFSFITEMYGIAKGKYIATCEGDDYWTDDTKLQMQIDFLDKHPKYALCFHPTRVVYESEEIADTFFPNHADNKLFDLEHLLQANFIQTSSVMYRNLKNYIEMKSDPLPGDWYAHLFHARAGKIGFIDRPMSVYRKHDGGVWSSIRSDEEKFWTKFGYQHLMFFFRVLELFETDDKYKNVIRGSIVEIAENIFRHTTIGPDIIGRIAAVNPLYPSMIIQAQAEYLHAHKNESQRYEADINELYKIVENKNQEIADIKSSKVWKLRNNIAGFAGKKKI
jgi:glycosyltransferase involved in cell wall biosynthesis